MDPPTNTSKRFTRQARKKPRKAPSPPDITDTVISDAAIDKCAPEAQYYRPQTDEENGGSMISTIMAPYEGRSKRRIFNSNYTLRDEEHGGSVIDTMMKPYEPKEKDMDDQSVMTLDSPYGQDALITGMERTFFAATNNAWLLVIAGVGLMSVGNNDDRAVRGGLFIFSAGIVMALLACTMHVWRVAQIKLNIAFPLGHSALWAVLISTLTFVALGLEMYFALTHPYLARSQTVVVTTAAPA